MNKKNKNSQSTIEQKNIKNEEVIDKNEELLKSIQSLENENKILADKIASYENEKKSLNDEYINKLKEKSEQAAILIEQKTQEISNRFKNDLETFKKYNLEKTGIEIVNVVNQFEIALNHKSSDPKIANYQNGFIMFLTMLKTLLREMNINEININPNQEFDSNYMECFETAHSDEIKENHVIKILKKGYKLYDRVIVPALVVVCHKSS